nr:hypothetical protein [Acidimicrobiia bacterium]
EFLAGISSVAAPVLGTGGEAVAAIHVHGPAYRFPAEGAADDIAASVTEAARRLSARLVDHAVVEAERGEAPWTT